MQQIDGLHGQAGNNAARSGPCQLQMASSLSQEAEAGAQFISLNGFPHFERTDFIEFRRLERSKTDRHVQDHDDRDGKGFRKSRQQRA